jgi:hypothetical protein
VLEVEVGDGGVFGEDEVGELVEGVCGSEGESAAKEERVERV